MLVTLCTIMTIVLGDTFFRPSSTAVAETLLDSATYRTNSPHWSHINVMDYGSDLRLLPAGNVQQSGYEWYARHIDFMSVAMATDSFIESHSTLSAELKAMNSTIKTFGSTLDLTICQHRPCAMDQPVNDLQNAFPEDQYLHFSEDTTMTFIDLDKTVVKTITVPGCPEPQPITPACRAQTFIWHEARWFPNLNNAAWRQMMSGQLIERLVHNTDNTPNPIDDMFLDEHGFETTFGYQATVTSGGAIREYNGLAPWHNATPSVRNAFDAAYNADVVSWLTYLRSQVTAAGKTTHINTGEYFMNALEFQQALATKGVMTEWLNAPDHFRFGAPMYTQFIDQMHQMTSSGGMVDLAFSWCAALPAGYSAGNYPTTADRYSMWNLASYYMSKEFPDETGRVYFDPNLCIHPDAPDPLDFEQQWLLAYEKDVGQPVDAATIIQHGPVSCSSKEYGIFARHYTKAYVLLRTRDDYDCQDYTDATAVNVPLSSTMVMLEPDGTLSVPINSVAIRNGEAVILFPAPDVTPPAAILDLHTD